MTLRIAILDDYQQVALKLADWASIGADAEVVSFGDHQPTRPRSPPASPTSTSSASCASARPSAARWWNGCRA